MNDNSWARLCRKRNAVDDVKARYRVKLAALNEAMQAEIDEIDRQYRHDDAAALAKVA